MPEPGSRHAVQLQCCLASRCKADLLFYVWTCYRTVEYTCQLVSRAWREHFTVLQKCSTSDCHNHTAHLSNPVHHVQCAVTRHAKPLACLCLHKCTQMVKVIHRYAILKHPDVACMTTYAQEQCKAEIASDLFILHCLSDSCLAHLKDGRQQHLEQLSSNVGHNQGPLSVATG